MSIISPKRYITFYGRAQFCRPFLLMREFGQACSERTDLPSPITGITSATMTQTFSHDTLDNPKYPRDCDQRSWHKPIRAGLCKAASPLERWRISAAAFPGFSNYAGASQLRQRWLREKASDITSAPCENPGTDTAAPPVRSRQ
jgi:hypothetical protein